MYPIYAYGSEEQKRRYLPELAAGTIVGCFGLTESDGGSDPGAMRTRARRDGAEWVLNGSKMWITNGPQADVAVVWAKDDEDVVQGFLVEPAPRASARPVTHSKTSLRASITGELVLEDVRVPDSARFPVAGGLEVPARLPHPGALRHRLGRARRARDLPDRVARLHEDARRRSGARSPRASSCSRS